MTITQNEIAEETTEKVASIGIAELWKWIAAIALSSFISFMGHYLSEKSAYVTKTDVTEIVSNRQAILENEMKHYDEALTELKQVVENNNSVMQSVKEELAGMRQELKSVLIGKLNDK